MKKAKDALNRLVVSTHSRQRVAKSQWEDIAEGLFESLEGVVSRFHEQVCPPFRSISHLNLQS
jgi:hypothetical protein